MRSIVNELVGMPWGTRGEEMATEPWVGGQKAADPAWYNQQTGQHIYMHSGEFDNHPCISFIHSVRV